MRKISFDGIPANYVGILQALRLSRDVINEMETNGGGLSREVALARTKIQEAYFWMAESKRVAVREDLKK